jgi:cytochrome c oxidase assembly factor CtaG
MTSFHWHPEVVAGLGLLLALYLLAGGPLRRRLTPGPGPAGRQVAAFAGGVAVLALALLGPLAEWAEHVALSAHMAQHLLLTLVVPPLWLLGTPPWLLSPLARTPGVGRAGFVLTRPVVALGLASAVLVLWHIPRFFEAALRTDALHALEHLTFLGTALGLWWPVAGPRLPEWPRPSPPAQLLYLFLATIPMTVVSAPITVAETVLYPFYTDAVARGVWPLPPRADQELAGVLMWVGGSLPYLVAGTIVYFRWALAEEPGPAGEPSGA